jgi:protein gp37
VNKSKIEWCDYTWNPVTGCLHGCEYCYAMRIAERFGLKFAPKLGDPGMDGACKYDSPEGMDTMLELEKPYTKNGRIQPYPMAFLPTFHRYRLGEPQKLKNPSKIFVSSMGDLFGEWVPDKWIEEVFKTVKESPQHTFLFLTKNPERYMNLYCNGIEFPENIMLGTTITSEAETNRQSWIPCGIQSFISIEPLIEPIKSNLYADWVIVGAMTGPGAIKPKEEWVQSIVDYCKKWKIPIFLKGNLNWPETIKEFPEGI